MKQKKKPKINSVFLGGGIRKKEIWSWEGEGVAMVLMSHGRGGCIAKNNDQTFVYLVSFLLALTPGLFGIFGGKYYFLKARTFSDLSWV